MSDQRTYNRLTDSAALALLDEHFGDGLDLYAIYADIPTILKVWCSGWDTCPEHPAQLHYAWLNDLAGRPTGIGFNDGVRLATRAALEMLQLDCSSPVNLLDAGSGMGGVSLQIEHQFATLKVREYSIHGISIAVKQAQFAARRNALMGATRGHLVVGNIMQMPYETEFFDGIIAIETLCYVPADSKKTLFEELFRVMKPGARAVVFDGYLYRNPQSSDERHLMTLVRNGWTLPELTSVAQTQLMMQTSGLEIEHSQPCPQTIRAAAAISRRSRLLLMPMLRLYRLLKRIGIDSQLLRRTGVQTANAEAFALAAVAQNGLVKRGLMTYFLHVLRKPIPSGRNARHGETAVLGSKTGWRPA